MANAPPASSIPQNHRPSLVSSSTPKNTSDYRYDVFLNHRGPDMKKGFAGHLYHRLRSHGIRVFLDKQEMQEGDNLTSQIIGAINTASVHVAIFSKNYAESNWCLKELVLMLESGATIIPVFHGVKPADLRWTQGEDRGYARGLHNLKDKMDEGKWRYHPDTIEEWRRALAHVAGISGFELEACNWDEGELVEKIDERVLRIVKKECFKVPKYEIGLDVKVEDFEAKFLSPQEQDREKPQAVGIVGLRGVGKTTLAKELFHRKSSSFIRSYFLSVVQENANKKTLFEELVDGLIRFDLPIYNDLESKLKSLKDHSSLVVLDGVEHVDKLDELFRIQIFLFSNSLILITSEDKDVLQRVVKEASIYKLTPLSTPQSRKLFCFHAFGEAAGPRQGYEYLVDEFVTVCEGLPLSLKVLGAFLSGKNDRSYWEDQLGKLQQTLPHETHEIDTKLQISYDALSAEEKYMFLDIVSAFIGERTDTAIRIWRRAGLRCILGFQILLEKQLVEVDSKNCINMHDHVKDFGKTILKKAGTSRPLSPWTDNNACLSQNSSSVITERKRKIDDLLRQSSAITEMPGKIDDLLQQSSVIEEVWGFMLMVLIILMNNEQVITELQEKIDGLVQQSSVITELREKIDGLVQQSSV